MLDGLDFAHLPWQRVLKPAKNELQNQYISLESRDQQGLIRIIPSDANTLVDIKGIGFTFPLLTIDRSAFSHLKALHSLKMYGYPKVDCIDVNGISASFNALP